MLRYEGARAFHSGPSETWHGRSETSGEFACTEQCAVRPFRGVKDCGGGGVQVDSLSGTPQQDGIQVM